MDLLDRWRSTNTQSSSSSPPPPPPPAVADAAAEDAGAPLATETEGNIGQLINHYETLKAAAVMNENYGEAERLKRKSEQLRRASLSAFREMHRLPKHPASTIQVPPDPTAPEEKDYDDCSAAAWLKHYNFDGLDEAIMIEDKLKTPFMQAVRLGNLGMCRWLHTNGASELSTSARDEGNTLLLIACFCGHVPIADFLYNEAGQKDHVRKENQSGSTPLHFACLGGHLECAQWLLGAGAAGDISKADNNGNTPMLAACSKGHLHIMKFLYECGAARDVFVSNHAGSTCLNIASSTFWFADTWKWLVLHGACNRDHGGHVLREVVQRETPRLRPWAALGKETNKRRRDMLAWAKEVLASHDCWLYCFLMGTLPSVKLQTAAHHLRELRQLVQEGTIPQDADDHLLQVSSLLLRGRMAAENGEGHRSPGVSPLVWRLGTLDEITALNIKSLIADFVGIERGRNLRNAREFAECLTVVISREAG